MKRYAIAFLLLSSFAACNNDSETGKAAEKDTTLLSTDLVTNPSTANGASAEDLATLSTMDFTDTMHDFGNINEGEVVVHEFEFKNNGKKPLIISGAVGSCGCTAPSYPHDPVVPGKSGIVTVKFNSKDKVGHQEKTVTINTNSVKGTHTLLIKAEVKESARANNAAIPN